VSIYALVWFCQVPALVGELRAGALLRRLWARETAGAVAVAAAVFVLAIGALVRQRPWALDVPANAGVGRSLPNPYPAGAVDYLASAGFTGNVMVPFEVGAFVSWKLHPAVKVSLDTRYEVAYRDELLTEHLELYAAGPRWRAILAKYPTDLVLVRSDGPLSAALRNGSGWRIAYEDDVYALFARPGVTLAYRDRRGEHLVAGFP
jgi:hypothetical protein